MIGVISNPIQRKEKRREERKGIDANAIENDPSNPE